jgi:hypothetical protein
MWRRWALGTWVASWALGACSSSDKFLYSPAEQATATVDGFPAARYGVPPERPLGTVLVASPGVVDMKFERDVKTRMLSVRMIVANNQDDNPWKIDTREVRAVLKDAGEAAPAYVNAERQQLPIVEVRRGEKQTLELFYPLTPAAQDAKHLPEFDLVWQVHTSERAVAERTPFERFELEAVGPEPYYYGWGFGPYWYHDPITPWPAWSVGAPVYWNYMRPAHVAPVPVYRRSPAKK